ncbi:diguanylate cyclase [Ectothiorhodospira haloalkaliphila]|uniref:diguanylate cyclase n=1 Tax=Ectothiorhodospira haloalkaliphila TaxID=421628 RepID=W8KK29_9GAMM|nr:diguanylate cyclase [Ectothiorhodospira haloalkaliphila]AHK80109.1 diguanylate cyclase [Ectothiorhodospira haloalkaliphila]
MMLERRQWAFAGGSALVILSILLMFLWSWPGATGLGWPEAIDVAGQERVPLAPYSAVYMDTARRTTPEALLDRDPPDFVELDSRSFNQGMSPGVLWVAFALQELDARPRLLSLDNPLFDSVTLFAQEEGGQWREVPRHQAVAWDQQRRPAWRHVFHIEADSPASRYLLRVETGQNLRFHAEIQTFEGHQAQATRFWLAQGGYHGIILALAVYNLFLLFSLRDASYAWYIAFILSTAGYFLFQRGVHLEFFPEWGSQTTQLLMFLCVALLSTFALQFTRRFLLMRRRDPDWDRWLRAALPLPLAGILLHVWLGTAGSVLFFSLVALAVIVLVVGASLRAYHLHDFRPALYLLLAWAAMFVGALLFVLGALGILPNNLITYYAVQVGSALETMLLSLALADRIRELQSEREILVRRGDQLERSTLLDDLTGLYNRRHLDRCFPDLVARAHSLGSPLSVAVIDADNFKQVNDVHGHAVGDQVLIRMGQVMADSVRRGDMVCRYGGEEFVVLMPGADEAMAGEIAERLRRAVASQPQPLGETSIRQTVSIGLATLQAEESADSLFLRADKALYEAKSGGKDRVVG